MVQSIFRALGMLVVVLFLAVLVPKVANFLSEQGLPVNQVLNIFDQVLSWFWSQLVGLLHWGQRLLPSRF